MIYGQCLGDAIGLTTEFKMKRDKPLIEFPYKNSIRDFPICDWTDDSDHMILVMMTLIEKGKLDIIDFASKLKNWAINGISELGDTIGLGLSGTINMVINNPKFLTEPLTAATEVWKQAGKNLAYNGSLTRTTILSAHSQKNIVRDMSVALCKSTHCDPRCVAACILFNDILWDVIHTNDHVDKILSSSVKIARKSVEQEAPVYEDEFAKWVKTGYTMPVCALNLDESGKINYVFKCLGAAIWVLQIIRWSQNNNILPSFKKVILHLAAECGDADANCAAAGALLGAYLGYDKLPQDWINAMPHHAWLAQKVDAFLNINQIITSTALPEEPHSVSISDNTV